MKVIFTLLFLFPTFFLAAQGEIKADPRLQAVYDQSYLDRLATENPFLIQRLNFYLDNAFYLSDYPAEKGEINFPIVEIQDLNAINILLLEREQGLHKEYDKEVVYSVNGARKVLIFRSGREFTRLLNEHLGRSYPK